jgi:cardiolipin synthase
MSADLLNVIGSIILIVYLIGVTIYIVLQNRSPQSTFAWLFLFILLPIIGLIIYYFFGRTWKTFAKENELARHEVGSDLIQDLKPLRDRQHEYAQRIAKKKPESYSPQLMRLVDANPSSILTGYNKVEILQNASNKYPRLLEDIKAAQHNIHLLYYIWTEDEFTLKLKAALIERAKAGVEVRALYDASGGMMSETYLQDLRQAGVQIHPYLQYRSLSRIHSVNYRSHRKIVVIDGSRGFMGGLNLDKDQLDGGKKFDSWRDTHMRIVGEAAHALQASFAINWFNTTGERFHGEAYYPPVDVATFTPIQVTFSGPDSQWAAIRQVYFFMIMAAQEKLYLTSPFFVVDESIMEALKAVALSGVDVRLMFTPSGSTYSIPYYAANTYFKEVAEAGARIYLYQAGYFHPKTLNIDGRICTIGSANMDIRSFSLNYEDIGVIYDQKYAKELEQAFLKDLDDCEEWTQEEYMSRSLWLRLRDSLSRLASPLF